MAIISCGGSTVSESGLEMQNLSIQTNSGKLNLIVEIADSPSERSTGLMNRQSLASDHGMLFIFESEAEHSFWMKNTYISLDIIFINANKEIIYIEENTMPQSLESISAGAPSLYVLEVNAGYTVQNGVKVGDLVSF